MAHYIYIIFIDLNTAFIYISAMNFYHYTTLKAWHAMHEGHKDYTYPTKGVRNIMPCVAPNTPVDMLEKGYVDGRFIRGLWPSQRFVPTDETDLISDFNFATRSVIEGFLEPYPKSWDENDIVPMEFERLINWISSRFTRQGDLVLLRIEAADQDEVYIADWSLARADGPGRENKLKASQAYFESLIPLSDYNSNIGYKCPIVVCFNPIEVERLSSIVEFGCHQDFSFGDIKSKAMSLSI